MEKEEEKHKCNFCDSTDTNLRIDPYQKEINNREYKYYFCKNCYLDSLWSI